MTSARRLARGVHRLGHSHGADGGIRLARTRVGERLRLPILNTFNFTSSNPFLVSVMPIKSH